YFFNSKDLNLLEFLKELAEAGVDSFKIEGRNKSPYYLATVVRAYRNVLDAILTGDKDYSKILKKEKENLDELVNRGYTSGFLLGREPEHNFDNSHNQSRFQFVGEVLKIKNEKLKIKNPEKKNLNLAEVKVHNAIYDVDRLEIVGKDGNHPVKILKMFDDKMKEVQSAHGGHGKNYYFVFDKETLREMDFLRKKNKLA
ncbi:MAG: hypothetical protein EOM84_00855, partial [Sphingobacteriia bacterium]|nr:hypothetical protein [Sphingobacteriia bacterium]